MMTRCVTDNVERSLLIAGPLTCFVTLSVSCAPGGNVTAVRRGLRLPPGELLHDNVDAEPKDVLRLVPAKGISLTKSAEGWEPYLYNDAAKYCTIGYGHLVKKQSCDGTEPPEFLKGISEPRGEELLVSDLRTAQRTVQLTVTEPLTDGQFAALVDFVFNVGTQNFRQSTLLKCVNAPELERVPAQFRRWILAGGKPWPGLKQRREREIELFFDGLAVPKAIPAPGEDLSPIDIRSGERGLPKRGGGGPSR